MLISYFLILNNSYIMPKNAQKNIWTKIQTHNIFSKYAETRSFTRANHQSLEQSQRSANVLDRSNVHAIQLFVARADVKHKLNLLEATLGRSSGLQRLQRRWKLTKFAQAITWSLERSSKILGFKTKSLSFQTQIQSLGSCMAY